MVDEVGVGGEEPEVHRESELPEEEEPRRREIGACQHRNEAEGDPDQAAEQQREEELGVVAGGECDGRNHDLEIAGSGAPHRVAEPRAGRCAFDRGPHLRRTGDRHAVDGDDTVIEA